jgi:membrane-anchored protein YejM (alkaline phosphatase superfamily)
MRWLGRQTRLHVVSSALLFAALLGVHELLALGARPAGAFEWAYLQLVVVAQCGFLTATVAAAAAVVPRLRRAIVGCALTLPPLLYVDSLVVQRVDRHLPALALLLLDARLDDNRRLLDATGIDLRAVGLFALGLGPLALAGAWLDARAEPLADRWARARTTRARVLCTWVGASILLAGLEAGAARAMTSAPWSRFGRNVPQVFAAAGPTVRARATLRAALRSRPGRAAMDDAMVRLTMPATPPSGDVFFFVVESLRADAVDPGVAPAMVALGADGLRFDAAVSGGNVTQYGWFSLFSSLPALYWQLDAAPEDAAQGAMALRLARKRGWRVEVLASSDLAYMHLDTFLLGPSHALADVAPYATGAPGTAAARDEDVMRELSARAGTPHPPTVYVVALDATHLPYSWSDGFRPPLEPYAPPNHYMHAQVEPAERRAVWNRYLDAVAFVDSLLARFVGALRAAGLYEDATIVVVGDHGEEFWEHGLAAHGSEPCAAQTHVALVIKPSRELRADGDWSSPKGLASGIDVWPTLLDAAGVRGDLSPLVTGASLVRGRTGAAVSASQRYWYRPGRFVLDDGRRRVELELRDPDHPFRVQDLHVLALRDETDTPTDDGLTARACAALVRDRFGSELERFFVVDW